MSEKDKINVKSEPSVSDNCQIAIGHLFLYNIFNPYSDFMPLLIWFKSDNWTPLFRL